MRFLIDRAHDGVLLRSYLKGTCKVSSRLLIRLKKRPDGITVNGQHVTVRYRLQAGDLLEISEQDLVSQEAFPPVELPFAIVYEDDDLLVVDKPPYMPTHPSAGHNGDTLANALTWLFLQRGQPFVFRPVSRLDRNTSGLLTLAKNQYAASMLCDAMQQHRIRKTYLAIVEGCPPQESGLIETGTRRKQEFFVLREVCSPDAPGASYTATEYTLLQRKGSYSLLELHPLTGRTHQLRVQLAWLGCPIFGDDLYGNASDRLARHALHATHLELPHPKTGKLLSLTSPLPEDLQALWDSLL